MCGRTACTLAPDALQKACRYCCRRSGKQREPQWRGGNDGEGDKSTYYPSYNVCPQNRTPVLTQNGEERALQTMKWGLLPSWHRGDAKSFAYNMSNARLDTLQQKASFKTPLKKGQRCVILADGFFEWQNVSGQKQPYFVYFKESDVKVEKKEDGEAKHKGITPRLLTMAGLFDVWTPPDGSEDSEPLYTYTIITVDASPSLKWLHHRMPAILDGEEAVSKWLDCGQYDAEKALLLLTSSEMLAWHPVSTTVNNSRNKTEDCVKKVDLNSPKPKRETALTSWLKKSPRKRPSQSATAESGSSEHNAPPPNDTEEEEPLAKKQRRFKQINF